MPRSKNPDPPTAADFAALAADVRKAKQITLYQDEDDRFGGTAAELPDRHRAMLAAALDLAAAGPADREGSPPSPKFVYVVTTRRVLPDGSPGDLKDGGIAFTDPTEAARLAEKLEPYGNADQFTAIRTMPCYDLAEQCDLWPSRENIRRRVLARLSPAERAAFEGTDPD